jgi:hypothetical protein
LRLSAAVSPLFLSFLPLSCSQVSAVICLGNGDFTHTPYLNGAQGTKSTLLTQFMEVYEGIKANVTDFISCWDYAGNFDARAD